jgi:type II secretory pathway pseudopilin PulG
MFLIIIFGVLSAVLMYQLTKWFYKTNHDRKIQVAAGLSASIYGLVFVLYLLTFSSLNDLTLPWRFYGLGGLVTTPLLLGYMVGNLGVSPTTGAVVE